MRRLALTILAAASGLALASVPAGARTDVRAADSIDYATSFGNFGRDAYVYVAIEKGYFRQANLDVSVTSGPGSVDNMKFVAAGRLAHAPGGNGAPLAPPANQKRP